MQSPVRSIPAKAGHDYGEQPAEKFKLIGWRPRRRWVRYAGAGLLIALVTLVAVSAARFVSPTNLVMLYLLAVVLASVFLGRGPAVLVSTVGILAFDFFIVPPRLTFAVADTQYLLTFFGLLIVGLVISQLTAQFQEQLETARRREAEVSMLYSFSRELAVAGTIESIMRAVIDNIGQNLGRQAVLLLPDGNDGATLQVAARTVGFHLNEKEMTLARQVVEQGNMGPAGEPRTENGTRFLPLQTAHGRLGVLGVAPGRDPAVDATQPPRLLESYASLAALAIERAQLQIAARNAQVLQATEKLQSALLNSISHDLRTPLVAITGVLSSLQDDETRLDELHRRNMIETAREEADRLNRLVGNLLDITRIEGGAMKVVREPADLQDLIGSALHQLDERLAGRPVQIEVEAELPLVPLGFGLMVQVLVNIIDNALKYSGPGTPIELRARRVERWAEISVSDRGSGIPPEHLTRVFDKFYRVTQPGSVSGTGMGLAICKGIVEAHGGQIWAETRAGGGTTLRLRLPLGEEADRPGGQGQ